MGHPQNGGTAVLSAVENALEKGAAMSCYVSMQCSQQLGGGPTGPAMGTWAGPSGSAHHSSREVSK